MTKKWCLDWELLNNTVQCNVETRHALSPSS